MTGRPEKSAARRRAGLFALRAARDRVRLQRRFGESWATRRFQQWRAGDESPSMGALHWAGEGAMDSRAAGHGLGEWMADAGIHLVTKEEQEKQGSERDSTRHDEDAADDGNAQNSSKKRGESVRTKVRNAQLKVLDKLNEIVDGNIGSAAEGNHNCAKFMLDWSGVSDLRSPLARPKQQQSLSGVLLKKLKQKPDSKKKSGRKK